MITIKTLDGLQFDLPVDLTLSIEETSVLTGKEGSFSLPIDLPESVNNLRILEFPNRISRKSKFLTNLDVIVSSGSWVRFARLDVESSQENGVISCTMFTGESAFYTKIENLDLKTVFKNKIRDDFAGQTVENKVQSWLEYLERIGCGDVQDDFYLFPVLATKEERSWGESTSLVYWTEYQILNRPWSKLLKYDGTSDYYPGMTRYSASGREYYMLAARSQWTYKKDYIFDDKSEEIIHPIGYLVTPFLKFSYVLNYIITSLGYELAPSALNLEFSFQKLCLINNTADAIMKGTIEYSQLVPDKSVTEFLEFIENSFGVEFTVDEVHKVITPRFWSDVLSQDASGSIDSVLEDYSTITFAESKSLKLTTSKIEENIDTEIKTYNQLFEKYVEVFAGQLIPSVPHCILDKKRLIYNCYTIERINIGSDIVILPRFQKAIKDLLDYVEINKVNDDKDLSYLNISMHDIVFGRYSQIEAWSGTYTPAESIKGRIPFIKSLRHMNTVIQNIDSDGSGTNQDAGSTDELSIIPCFYVGLAQPDTDLPEIEKTFFGSTHRYDNLGNTWGVFDLTTRSLYNVFWHAYNDMIKTSFHEVSGSALMSEQDIMNFKFDELLMLDGQKVLPSSIKYEVRNDDIEVIELKVKTVKPYQ